MNKQLSNWLPNERSHLYWAGVVFLCVLLFWFWQTKEGQDSWNEASRLATIESLVERGNLAN